MTAQPMGAPGWPLLALKGRAGAKHLMQLIHLAAPASLQVSYGALRFSMLEINNFYAAQPKFAVTRRLSSM